MPKKQWTISPKAKFILTEGIKKGLRLYQELQGNEDKFFIIVVDGVTTFFSAPESREVLGFSKDRDVFLCFDADTGANRKRWHQGEIALFTRMR